MDKISKKIIIVVALISNLILVAQNQSNSKLLFSTGYENGVTVVPDEEQPDILGIFKGKDTSKPEPNDFNQIKPGGELTRTYIFYEGGTDSMRYAKIVADPTNPKNHVMKFWVNQANAMDFHKTRVQQTFHRDLDKGLKEFSYTVRLFIHPDFKLLEQYPTEIGAPKWINQRIWFSLMEFWNNPGKKGDSLNINSRVTLAFDKADGVGQPIHFSLQMDDNTYLPEWKKTGFNTVWFQRNEIPIPYGKWATYEVYVKEGNAQTGRVKIDITVDGEAKRNLFDVTNFTHPTTDLKPDGFTDFTPLKLYAGKDLADFMRAKGGAMQLMWDDFAAYEGKLPKINHKKNKR